MRFDFKELPEAEDGYLRPVLDVSLEGLDVRYACLVDTGSLHNRFAAWTAELTGIDLEKGNEESLALGGVVTRAVQVPVDLAIGEVRWRAPVSFCDPWPFGFQLLGQEGFLRFFHVLLRASTSILDIDPDAGPPT